VTNLLGKLTQPSHGFELKYFIGQAYYVPTQSFPPSETDFLKQASHKKLQQAVRRYAAMRCIFKLSFKAHESHSKLIQLPLAKYPQFPFRELPRNTKHTNREVSSKLVYHAETNWHYKLSEPFFVPESRMM
jgi:hypothetical protein